MHGHIGRCLITSRDPETAEVDLPTLELLAAYRREIDSTEPLPFGIYGEVLVGGTVRHRRSGHGRSHPVPVATR